MKNGKCEALLTKYLSFLLILCLWFLFLNFQSIFFCIACILYVRISSKFENYKTGVPNKVGFVERTTALDSILAVDNSEGRPFQKKKSEGRLFFGLIGVHL